MGERKLHYKMYKDGKKFVFAAIATFSFLVAGGVSTVEVHADTAATTTASSASDTKSAAPSTAATATSSTSDTKSAAPSTAATATSSTSDTKSAAPSTAATATSSASDTKSAASSTAATAASSSSDTKSVAPSSATTAASSSSDTKSVAPSSATAASSASDTKSAAPSTAATAASSTSDTKNPASSTDTTRQAVQVSYKDIINKLDATTGTASTEVTKDNFLQYFSLNGSATYDQSTGIVTITPDDNNQVGNFALKSKIDTNSSFTLTGQVNLGSDPNGADGISFAFHDGNTTDLGNSGGNLGIGGLLDALGFKLDTWGNGYRAPSSDKDGSQIDPTNSNDFGWNDDSMSAPYGTFVTTSDEQIKSQDGTSVQRWWAKDVAGSAQALSTSDVDGQFHDFTVHYDGTTRTVTVSYKQTDGTVLTWSQQVADSYQAVAFIVSASTGGAKNLQQFKLTSFEFTQAATVNVKYVDTDGNQIGQSEVSYPNGAAVNGTYSTTQLDIPGYTFIKMGDGSLSASGTLTQAGDNGTVTYVYTKNPVAGGNVTAKYVDENGNPIADNVVSSGNVGDPYSTTQKDVPGYTFKEVQGNPTGSFTDQDQTVTYVYTKDPVAGGNVTAKYVDENGNPIADNVVSSGNVGDPYSTTQKDVPGYTFKEVQGNPTGSFTDQDQTVTYVYTKDPVAGGNVTAKYVDENGNPIADNVVSSGNVGDPYSTTQKDVPGYTFKEVQGNPTGSFTDQDQTVTYVYTKDPVAGGNVTAKYVDENGNPIADNVVSSGNVGDPYSTTQKDVPGYTFKEVQGNPTGSFTDQDQTVTYVYTKDPVAGGNVTAKYVDENGNPIADNVVSSGNVGDPYSTTQKDVPGYTFKEVQGNPTGSFTDQDQTVTYVYTKDPVAGGNVTAKYVDENGNPIADNVVSSGNVGDPYSTTQKDVPGYTFKEVQGNPTGSFTDQDQTVTYVYTKDPVAGGNVTAKYVDENGNPIADNVVSSGNVGDPYSTTQKDVPGYTFKEVQGNPTGSFTDQDQTVTYVYTKDPVAGGNVTAKYVDENGNPIADNVVSSGNVGDPYSTTQKDVPGYTFKEVQGNPTGSFTDQDQTVTYVYTKDPVAGGNVTAKYVDENGNPIADNVVSSGNVGDPYSTTQKDVPGYTFKEVQGNPTGSFTDQDQTVTYVYTKDPVAGGNVTAKYVDENGNPIADNVVSSGNVGDPYSTTQKDVPGYTFKEVQGNPTGSFTDQDQTVTYVYTKDPVAGGNVTAKYVDENGNPIADNVVSSGNVGDPYSTTQKDVPGYTFKEVQGNPTGSFTDQDQTVTYVYTKNPVTDNNGSTGSNPSGKPGNGTDTGNSSSNQPGNPSQPSNTTNNGVINTSTNTGSKVNNGVVSSPKLPQTGENNSQSQTMSFAGILLAMFGGLLGFLGIKKRRND
ncbi:LPXTG cell wall anchor domain-containing protein [Levilactobacillus brevis]|uniref:MucBP domain-containing protein n=1 Tax=Levilactobacillus brevis TaxID=1580 RepID=UPI000FF73DC0|nr:MucBP domain-containing protein [Levilactobacillus brevis]RWZ42933.1 LPXTG cell wall anchor domain-containing protein [Levilactobacillus brevis]